MVSARRKATGTMKLKINNVGDTFDRDVTVEGDVVDLVTCRTIYKV